MPLFRYPGGKSKLQSIIARSLIKHGNNTPRQYREPFFGGGGVGMAMLDYPSLNRVWLNDKDPGIASVWTAVAQHPGGLIELIERFTPSIDAFDSFKDELLTVTSVPAETEALVNVGFKKLALHQMSFSGLGTKSGGPLGGRAQLSKAKIDSRWSAHRLCLKIDEFHHRFAAVNVSGCTCLDFADLIEDETCDCLIYCDPPYVVQGNNLYQCGFTEQDHVRLAECLRKTPHPWVLSYDDCPLVRDLYSWAQIVELAVGYSVSSVRRTSELLITSGAEAVSLPIKVRNERPPSSYLRAS
jgi:DNA adenine methylase